VRVLNEGTVEARGLKFTVTFYDANKRKVGQELSGPLGGGVLPGGATQNIPFQAGVAPAHISYQLKLNWAETPPEVALAGGEFSNVEDVELAHFTFTRPDPKKRN